MFLERLKKSLLPNRASWVPILRGPFRGAKLHTTLRDNLRKVFGLYEHELNDWLEAVLPCVDRVIDVGANDGYFTLGCAAAFRRLKRPAQILAFEPQAVCCEKLAIGAKMQFSEGISITIEQTLVGRADGDGQISLDSAARRVNQSIEPRRALLKIDVEGAEIDVIEGASLWLNSSNYFMIEVHRESFLEVLKSLFAAAGLTLQQRDMKPLPILGSECRAETTWFLVSDLSDDKAMS